MVSSPFWRPLLPSEDGTRILVAGGRTYANHEKTLELDAKAVAELNRSEVEKFEVLMEQVIESLQATKVTIVHGCAPGADRLAEQWAIANGHGVIGFLESAISNPSQMISEGSPHFAVLLRGGRGTAEIAYELVLAGVPLRHL